MLKIYTLIHDFSLCTPIVVGGRCVSVVFGGGCKAFNQNGEFSTTDEALQRAIENSKGFGKVYKLHKSFAEAEEKACVVSDEVMEKVCATVNEAAEWLVGLGCNKQDVSSSVGATDAARELGYVLKFKKA